MIYRLTFIGFGVVGQGLTDILMEKKDYLKSKFGFEYKIVAVSDRLKGSVANPDGLDPKNLLLLVKNGKSLNEYPDGIAGLDALSTINQIPADVMIEASYTDVKTGEPATSHCRAAFENNMHVITTNKGPAALFYPQLKKLAGEKYVQFGIEGTVMSGAPVINTAVNSLAGCTISSIWGILNGTTNFILSEMEEGKSYNAALKNAQELGYAEADPTGDLDGWDAVAKVVILANVVLDGSLKIEHVEREGIRNITPEDIQNAKLEGSRWKLLGEIKNENGKLITSVKPVKLPVTDPLANVMGATNAITFQTDLLGPVTIVGAGAGKRETGFSLLTDLLAIHRSSAMAK